MEQLEHLLYKRLRAKFGPDVTVTFRYAVNLDALTFEVSEKEGDKVKAISNAITGLEVLQSTVLEKLVDNRVDHVYEQFHGLK
jgi:hypothetical protein